MPSNLVIVESPAKAKTIEKFLGPDFKVASSFGHIRDLTKGGSNSMGIDIANQFMPDYEISKDKKDIVRDLKKWVKSCDTVWLASDEDREGEAIAWHLAEALSLDPAKTKRIVFNEITKKAITHAIENPRHVDMALVNAQQARRVLDRIVGFELSPILWRKVKSGLSAGRVQSVAVRLIVERERDIHAFLPVTDFKVEGQFNNAEGEAFKADWSGQAANSDAVQAQLDNLQASPFHVASLTKKTGTRKPAAPFTTSTLQQEASRKLGFSVNRTMSVAQKLYEVGLITYMRTDSVNLSDEALGLAATAITESYGENYVHTRKFSTKSKGAQEAHEAIRPTDLSIKTGGNDDAEEKLYTLIRRRTLASQMADAKIDRTVAHLDNQDGVRFVARGEMVAFDGFMKVYLEGKDESEAEVGLLPALTEGGNVTLLGAKASQRFTRPKGRYTEASLVKALEEKGIGRPSTYAPTITTIQKRAYVQKGTLDGKVRDVTIGSFEGGSWSWEVIQEKFGANKGRLVPTDIGNVVTDFLLSHFDTVMDYAFTANIEQEFDLVASGQVSWTEVIDSFYQPFIKTVGITKDVDPEKGERSLGEQPKTGKKVIARLARYGPVVQVGETTETEKAKFVSIPAELSIETITLDEALELLKMPRVLGSHEGVDIKANLGWFGPYVQMSKTFASIPEEQSPYTINLTEAMVLIEAKLEADRKANIATLDGDKGEIRVLNGRYGPYLKFEKKNVTIPKDVEPESLTYEAALALIEEAASKPKRGRKGKAKK